MDRAAWRATVHGVTGGQTGLSGLNTRRLCSFKIVPRAHVHARVHARAHPPCLYEIDRLRFSSAFRILL